VILGEASLMEIGLSMIELIKVSEANKPNLRKDVSGEIVRRTGHSAAVCYPICLKRTLTTCTKTRQRAVP